MKREIVILKVIEHPHVLKLYDVLETVVSTAHNDTEIETATATH